MKLNVTQNSSRNKADLFTNRRISGKKTWLRTACLFIVTMAAAMVLTACGDMSNQEDMDYHFPKVLLANVYENLAWGYEQHISIVDSDGYIYIVPNEYLPSDRSMMKQEDWYEKFVKVAENEESTRQIGKGDLKSIRRLYGKLDEYIQAPYKEYGSGGYDMGSNSLYLIYFDEDEQPQYLDLFSYGDWIDCLDNDDIRKFANKISRSIHYKDKKEFIYD